MKKVFSTLSPLSAARTTALRLLADVVRDAQQIRAALAGPLHSAIQHYLIGDDRHVFASSGGAKISSGGGEVGRLVFQ